MYTILVLFLLSNRIHSNSTFVCANDNFFINVDHINLGNESLYNDYLTIILTDFDNIGICIYTKSPLIDSCISSDTDCQKALETYLYLELVLHKVKYIASKINEKKENLLDQNKTKLQDLMNKIPNKIKDLIEKQIVFIINKDKSNRYIIFNRLKIEINRNIVSKTGVSLSDIMTYFQDSVIYKIISNNNIVTHEDFLNVVLPSVVDPVVPDNNLENDKNKKIKGTYNENSNTKSKTDPKTGSLNPGSSSTGPGNVYVNPNDASNKQNTAQNTPSSSSGGFSGFNTGRNTDRAEMQKEREKRQMEAFKQRVLGKTILPNSSLPPRNPRPVQAARLAPKKDDANLSQNYIRPNPRSQESAFNRPADNNTFQNQNNFSNNNDTSQGEEYNFNLNALMADARRAAQINTNSEIASRHSDLFKTISFVYERYLLSGDIAESSIEISETIKRP